jgi:hypothetical protein
MRRVSLDIDIVVAVDDVESVVKAAGRHGLRVERFKHSINISGAGSDLRRYPQDPGGFSRTRGSSARRPEEVVAAG